MKKILICEFFAKGHHSEYILHLINYISKNPSKNQYFFLLSSDFLNELPEMRELISDIQSIKLLFFTDEEYETIKRRKHSLLQSIYFYRLINKYAINLSIQSVIYMNFNVVQFAIGLYRPKYLIKGILFMPFHKMRVDSCISNIKYRRKYFQTLFFLKNHNIKRIYILNDSSTVQYLNNIFKKNIFHMLPDPISDDIPLLKDFEIHKEYQIKPNRKIFLHSGSLNYRKGTFDILDAVNYLPKEKQSEISILLIGEASSQLFKQELLKRIDELKKTSLVQIIWENNFVSSSRLRSIFSQVDCVLLPYKNAEASSGILGHAIISQKKVIVPDYGLLGEIVTQYKFGITIPNTYPETIAQSIISITKNKLFDIDAINQSSFLKTHSASLFSKLLLEE
jgi:glycosyltransferase involved in cell wall biosynthesis